MWAVILIDARKGILTQTRRHSFIASLMGIKHVVVAVNKMDLTDYDEAVFDQIESEYRAFAESLNIDHITCIPLSALNGENIIERSSEMAWYNGPSLMAYLETVEVESKIQDQPFRMPVQWVNRPNLDFRGFSGQISAGQVEKGMAVKVMPSGKNISCQRNRNI